MTHLVCRNLCYFLHQHKKSKNQEAIVSSCLNVATPMVGILPIQGGILSSPEPKWMQIASTFPPLWMPLILLASISCHQPKGNVHRIKVGV